MNVALVMRLVLVLLAVPAVGCGKPCRTPLHVIEADASRPFRAEVAEAGDVAAEEGLATLLQLVGRMHAERENYGVPERCTRDLAREMILQEQYGLLEGVFSGTEAAWHRDAILTALMSNESPGTTRLLESLAENYPEDFRLAHYREGGIEYLLGVVEDQARPGSERIRVIRIIGRVGTDDAIPRLKVFANDPSESKTPIGGAIGAPRTVGYAVTQAIQAIRSRSAAGR